MSSFVEPLLDEWFTSDLRTTCFYLYLYKHDNICSFLGNVYLKHGCGMYMIRKLCEMYYSNF